MKIPRYSPQGSLTTKAPAAEQSVQTAGMMGGEISKLGGVLNQIGEKFVEIDIATQKNEAAVTLAQKETDIKTRASQDVNINDDAVAAGYKKELADAYKDTLGGFSIPQARNEFQSRADLQMIGANSDITGYSLKGKISKGIASSQMAIDGFKVAYGTASTPEGRDAAILSAEAKVDEGTRAGFWDAEEAYKKKKEIQKEFNEELFKTLVSEGNFDEAERLLVKGELPGLSADESVKWGQFIDSAKKSAVNAENKAREEERTQRLLDMSMRMAKGEVGAAEIYDAVENGDLTPKQGKQAMVNLNQLNPTTNKKDLLDIYKKFQDPKASLSNIIGIINASELNDRDREDWVRVAQSDFESAMRAGQQKPATAKDYRRSVAETLNKVEKSANLGELWAARNWVKLTLSVADGLVTEGDLPGAIKQVIQEGIVEKLVKENPNLAGESGDIVDNGYRLWAVTELTKAKLPLTSGNINALKEQLKQRDGI